LTDGLVIRTERCVVKQLDYRPDIDGLRAIAVLSVVAYHAFPRSLPGGFVGVDIFFVISGFLISSLIYKAIQSANFTYTEFYARRLRRIFPALIAVLLASLLYGWFQLLPNAYRELGRQALASAGFASNVLFWTESGYFDEQAVTKPLLHLWSLGVEEQFYLICPMVLLYSCTRLRQPLYALGALTLISFAANIVQTGNNPTSAFYLPLPRFWELFLGVMLGYYYSFGRTAEPPEDSHLRLIVPRTRMRHSLFACAPYAGLLLIALSLLLIRNSRPFPGYVALLPTVGTALVISGRHSLLNRVLLASRPLVFIGLISYPLYLWHWIMLVFLHVAHYSDHIPIAKRLGAVTASFALAAATYRYIEKPIRTSKRRARFPTYLLVTMVMVALGAALVVSTDGGAFRYPPLLRPLAAIRYDGQRDFYEGLYRDGVCFLGARQTYADIGAQCIDPPLDNSKLVVLWGDSHAASLYPGLRSRFAETRGYRIAQFTASACPPLLGFSSETRRNCAGFNQSVIRTIARLHPDVVVLEGAWAFYSGADGRTSLEFDAIHRTLLALRKFRVVVMGSLPAWKINQADVILRLWQQDRVLEPRTYKYFKTVTIAADQVVREAASGTGARFISPLQLLCAPSGCLLSADPVHVEPVAWDRGHLSREGSRLLIDLAWPQFMDAATTP
jgi:peptidoglycan/LPS O-acetylase OafA/YrhL